MTLLDQITIVYYRFPVALSKLHIDYYQLFSLLDCLWPSIVLLIVLWYPSHATFSEIPAIGKRRVRHCWNYLECYASACNSAIQYMTKFTTVTVDDFLFQLCNYIILTISHILLLVHKLESWNNCKIILKQYYVHVYNKSNKKSLKNHSTYMTAISFISEKFW